MLVCESKIQSISWRARARERERELYKGLSMERCDVTCKKTCTLVSNETYC